MSSINAARKLEALERAVELAENNDSTLDPRESLALSTVSTDIDERAAALERAFTEAGHARGHVAHRAHVDVLTAGLARPANATLRRLFPDAERYRAVDRRLRSMDPTVRAFLKVAAADGVVNAVDSHAILMVAVEAQKRAFAAGEPDVARLYERANLIAALRAYGPPDLRVEGKLAETAAPAATASPNDSCPVPTVPSSCPAPSSCPVPVPTEPVVAAPAPAPVASANPEPSRPVDANDPLAGTRYAGYSEPLREWSDQFWADYPQQPQPDPRRPIPGDPMRWALSLLDQRYPAGADLLRKVQRDPDFQRLSRQLLYANRHSQREAASRLATLVHEAGHIAANRFKDYGSGRNGAIFTRVGYDWGGDNEHPMPPLRGKVPMRAIARYAEQEDRTYLKSKWNCYIEDRQHPERVIGSLGVERLLEETIQYGTSLLTAHAMADRTRFAPMNDTRAGLQTTMRYLTTYLGHVRRNDPQHYEELAGNPRWRDLILNVWSRSEYALRLTENQRSVSLRDPVFDEDDIRQWGHQRSPRQLLDSRSRATGESHLSEIRRLVERL